MTQAAAPTKELIASIPTAVASSRTIIRRWAAAAITQMPRAAARHAGPYRARPARARRIRFRYRTATAGEGESLTISQPAILRLRRDYAAVRRSPRRCCPAHRQTRSVTTEAERPPAELSAAPRKLERQLLRHIGHASHRAVVRRGCVVAIAEPDYITNERADTLALLRSLPMSSEAAAEQLPREIGTAVSTRGAIDQQ